MIGPVREREPWPMEMPSEYRVCIDTLAQHG